MSSSSLFESLPTRPPTPPRDISKDVDAALRFLDEGHAETRPVAAGEMTDSLAATSTPTRGPPVSSLTAVPTTIKKVDFHEYLICHEIPHRGQSSSPASRGSRQTPLASRQLDKPLKSILKARPEHAPQTPDDLDAKLSNFSPQEPGSFRKMLQSVLHQLATPSRHERLDAYQAINGTLKTYENVPDAEAVVERIDLLTQFLARDIAWKDAGGKLDKDIVVSALQLATVVGSDARIATALDNDFRTFVVDRSILILEQDGVSKAIMKAHLFLLCLRSKAYLIGPTRAERLFAVLKTLTDRCSGQNAVAARLIIYSRLIDQAPQLMLSKMRDWLENVFHAVLSSVEDTRTRAIDTFNHTGLVFGGQLHTCKVVNDICESETETENDQSYGDWFNLQLMQMTADKDCAVYVPMVWSAVILCWRSKRGPVTKWPKFRAWLLTIQKCLNSGDMAVRRQAYVAWDKLVFTVMPDSSTAETLRSMLKIPIVGSLEPNDKLSPQQRRIAIEIAKDSYCNLLHYALRPALNSEELDVAWDMYVDPVLTRMATQSDGKRYASRVLQGLLRKSTGAWNSNAANERGSIKPDELPRLDCRWVRSRLHKLIKVLEPLLLDSMWSPSKLQVTLDETWLLLLEAVGEAGSQEVKISNDLRQALAQLTNLFRRIWYAASDPPFNSNGNVWLERYQALVETATKSLGPGHFVEDVLTKTNANEIEAAPTPSQRTSKHPPPIYSPFLFLLALYYQPAQAILTTGEYDGSIARFVQLFSDSKSSSHAILTLLQRSMRICSEMKSNPTDTEVQGQIWNAIAGSACAVHDGMSSQTPPQGQPFLGSTLSIAIDMLSEGLRLSKMWPACLATAMDLYSSMCRAAKHHAAEGGVVLGVAEPLAKSALATIGDRPSVVTLELGRVMLDNSTWPKNRQSLDHSRKALWAISLELPKTAVFDPYSHLYLYLNEVMDHAYRNLSAARFTHCDAAVAFHDSLGRFLQRCPPYIFAAALGRLQVGIATWVEDKSRQYTHRPAAAATTSDPAIGTSQLRVAMRNLWSALLRLLSDLSPKDSILLQSIELLLSAGLSSHDTEIANKTIGFWNSTFGTATSLEYPARLLQVLRARRAQTEVSLPGIPDDNGRESLIELPELNDTQLNGDFTARAPKHTLASMPGPTLVHPKSFTDNIYIRQHLELYGPSDRGNVSLTPKPQRNLTPKKAKLRHEDSQMDFAPIDSSPAAINDESQLLTERQREIKMRQQENAQMYPAISSSPIRGSMVDRSLPRKLNFTSKATLSREEEEQAFETPTSHDYANLMSDDLPSSPTPRASSTVKDADETRHEPDDAEETEIDPPSSPPPRDEEFETALDAIADSDPVEPELTNQIEERDEERDELPVEAELPSDVEEPEQQRQPAECSDLPSDTPLPAAQLLREQKDAQPIEPTPLTESEDADPVEKPDHMASEEQVNHATSPNTPARVADSFAEPEEDGPGSRSNSQASTPRAQSGGRKRKRSREVVYTSKKRKHVSPIKRFFSSFLGQSQENDDGIEDEIVVAMKPTTPEPEAESNHVAETSVTSIEQPSADVLPVKRGPGRPRKSDSSVSRVAESAAMPRKRSASAMSSASTRVEEDTPGRAKSKRQRDEQDRQLAKSMRKSQEEAEVVQLGGRVATAVVVPHLRERESFQHQSHADVDAEDSVGDDEQAVAGAVTATPDRQLAVEQMAALQERRIAQPQSLLGRLRGALADCKKMILGSQEERELDDMLFEIRREVHEAARRGRSDV